MPPPLPRPLHFGAGFVDLCILPKSATLRASACEVVLLNAAYGPRVESNGGPRDERTRRVGVSRELERED